jgi:cyclic pyranopterin phosphate synthase
MDGLSSKSPSSLVDPFGRAIRYVRVSVTDRCDLRCVYCMSEDMHFLPKAEILSLEEIDRLASCFVAMGTDKIRLTGGEPLVRRNVMDLFRSLGRHLQTGALSELTLTTNGTQLDRFAQGLAEAGVRRINVSLDTLKPDLFRDITRWGRIEPVLEGLQAAKAAGLAVKINAVALKGVNEDEIDRLVEWCGEQGFDLVLIEVMPMGEIGDNARLDQYLPLSLVRQRLEKRWTLDESDHRTGGPARYVRVRETGRLLGFITPLTHNFCESCNRVRVTCTGRMYMCLGQEDAADLRSALRDHPQDDAALEAAIREAITRKPKGHDFVIDRRRPPVSVPRHMSTTGG